MAGQLTISTLNNDTGVLATENGMTGIAKAWVNFNGTGTVAIRDSFNVSSITDNGTGEYTVNFTTAMPNANYSTTLGASESTSAMVSSVSLVFNYFTNSATTTSVKVQTGTDITGANFAFSAVDMANINVSVFSS